ncbi:unnamed protein product, partial [Rotaria sordida]
AFISKHPTGKLDKDTFIATFKQLFPESSKNLTSSLFDIIDINHDGTIDFNEFLFRIRRKISRKKNTSNSISITFST